MEETEEDARENHSMDQANTLLSSPTGRTTGCDALFHVLQKGR